MGNLIDKNTRKRRCIIGICFLGIIITIGYMLFNNRRFDGEYSEISWLLSNYKQDQYLIVDSYTKYVQFKNEIETKYVQLKQGNETTTLDQYTKDFFQQYSLVCAISYNAEWAYPVYVKEKEETVYIKICKEANEER